jgi:hypothetical protein
VSSKGCHSEPVRGCPISRVLCEKWGFPSRHHTPTFQFLCRRRDVIPNRAPSPVRACPVLPKPRAKPRGKPKGTCCSRRMNQNDRSPRHVWDGHSCPLPLTSISTLTLICHPEEAESHAKRVTPGEGPMHFPTRLPCSCQELRPGRARLKPCHKEPQKWNPASAAAGPLKAERKKPTTRVVAFGLSMQIRVNPWQKKSSVSRLQARHVHDPVHRRQAVRRARRDLRHKKAPLARAGPSIRLER